MIEGSCLILSLVYAALLDAALCALFDAALLEEEVLEDELLEDELLEDELLEEAAVAFVRLMSSQTFCKTSPEMGFAPGGASSLPSLSNIEKRPQGRVTSNDSTL